MSSCLWRVVVGMALFGFVATLEVPAVVAKEPTAITDQAKSFEGPDRDAAHETAMKWIDDLNPAFIDAGPLTRGFAFLMSASGVKRTSLIPLTNSRY